MVYGLLITMNQMKNKIHSSVLFDLQQYTFQHGQPTAIQSLSEMHSNRAASVNIRWKWFKRKVVEFTPLRPRAFI